MIEEKYNNQTYPAEFFANIVNGARIDDTSVFKIENGALVQIWPERCWFELLNYSFWGTGSQHIQSYTNSWIDVYDSCYYGQDGSVDATYGKFKANAGDVLQIEYFYDLHTPYTAHCEAYAQVVYNINSAGQGDLLQTFFFERSENNQRKSDTRTFTFNFSQNYNNVGLRLFVRSWCLGTSSGTADCQIKFLNIYLNGRRVKYPDQLIN